MLFKPHSQQPHLNRNFLLCHSVGTSLCSSNCWCCTEILTASWPKEDLKMRRVEGEAEAGIPGSMVSLRGIWFLYQTLVLFAPGSLCN